MATKKTIMGAIVEKVGRTTFSIWRIGLTHDLAERRTYWRETKKQNVSYWESWEAASLPDAQDIENRFINGGMKGGEGGNLSSRKAVYVYVF